MPRRRVSPGPSFTASELSAATGGRWAGEAPASIVGISTDTRAIRRGDLFIALKGERFDAHAFVAQAAADRARHEQSSRPTWTPPDALDALEEKRPLPSAKPLTLSPPTKTRSDAQRRDAAPTRPAGGRELP